MNLCRPLIFLLLAGSAALVQAQSADWTGSAAGLKTLNKALGKKIILAAANVKVGVSLERLSLISGEGNMDKKLLGGAMALVANFAGVKGDFASREPIAEHLAQEDAEKIALEATEMLVAKFKLAGFEVEGPQAMIAAPFYAASKGEAKTNITAESQPGGLFKTGFYHGVYQTSVMGMKFRDYSGFAGLNRDTETFAKARELASASSALELNLALVNNKSSLLISNLGVTLWGRYEGSSTEFPAYTAVLKNPSEFKVASGGKDTYLYWLALKPQVELMFDDIAKRAAAGYGESVTASSVPATKEKSEPDNN